MKFNKIISVLLTLVLLLSFGSISAFAEDNEKIQFVVLDDNGQEVERLDLVYDEQVAAAYENYKRRRDWIETTYYNLGSSDYTFSGGSASFHMSGRYFYPNSAKRLYYHAETTGRIANISLYDVTNDVYEGSVQLVSQGNNTFLRNGYFTGLGANTKYSVGIISTSGNFSSYYYAISWSSL